MAHRCLRCVGVGLVTRDVCSICGGRVGDHDMQAHTDRLGRNRDAWDAPVGLPEEAAAEGGRLVRQNASLRRRNAELRDELAVLADDLAVATGHAEQWERTARMLGQLHDTEVPE